MSKRHPKQVSRAVPAAPTERAEPAGTPTAVRSPDGTGPTSAAPKLSPPGESPVEIKAVGASSAVLDKSKWQQRWPGDRKLKWDPFHQPPYVHVWNRAQKTPVQVATNKRTTEL